MTEIAKLEISLGETTTPLIDRSGPSESPFVYVDISSVDRETKRIGETKSLEAETAPSRAKQHLRMGDVLISMTRPNLNAVAMVTSEFDGAIGSTGFHVLRAKFVEPKFLFYLVQTRTFIDAMNACVQGALYPAVRPKDIESFRFLLPPLPEQHRIVAKIEELFSELDKGVDSLKTAREQLKVYRQALLKHAFEGKLTAQWRAENGDKLETATALQQRIQTERQERHRQQLADWEAKGKQGSKPKAPKPLPPLSAEELAELPELPAGWGWAKLGLLASQITDGEHFRPQITEQGVPFLSAKDVRAAGVSFDSPLFISQETAEKAWGRCRPERSDILIVSRGATVGRMCAVNTDQTFCLLGSVILIKGIPAVLPAYLLAALKAPLVNKKIVGVSGATAQQAIYLRDIQNVPLAVCSLSEQFEIVQELESKLSEADQLDQTLNTALQQSAALRQSILKKAFCGQLVKQDKNDEPASVLLERISAEKARSTKNGGIRGKKQQGKSNVQNLHIAFSNPEILENSFACEKE